MSQYSVPSFVQPYSASALIPFSAPSAVRTAMDAALIALAHDTRRLRAREEALAAAKSELDRRLTTLY